MHTLPVKEDIRNMIRSSKSMLFLHEHGGNNDNGIGEYFLLAMLDLFQAEGVKHIFLEQLPNEVNNFKRNLSQFNQQIRSTLPLRVNLLIELMIESHKRGINVQGIDTDFKEYNLYARIRKRDLHMGAQIKLLAKQQPYIVIAGLLHAKGLKNIFPSIPTCFLSLGEEKIIKDRTQIQIVISKFFSQHVQRYNGGHSLSIEDQIFYNETKESLDYIVNWPISSKSFSFQTCPSFGLGRVLSAAVLAAGGYALYQWINNQ